MVELFANSGNPDQSPRVAASDQGFHCLQIVYKSYKTWSSWLYSA